MTALSNKPKRISSCEAKPKPPPRVSSLVLLTQTLASSDRIHVALANSVRVINRCPTPAESPQTNFSHKYLGSPNVQSHLRSKMTRERSRSQAPHATTTYKSKSSILPTSALSFLAIATYKQLQIPHTSQTLLTRAEASAFVGCLSGNLRRPS
jgi:hypothetical protein